MSAWLPGRRFACMLTPFRPRAPLLRTPQLLGQPRPHHLTFASTAERPAVCLTSLHPHDWTGLRIGTASTDTYDIAYWKCITSTYARKMIIDKTPIGTSGHALVWPHQVNCSLPKYTDGRQQFWKGCQIQPSKQLYASIGSCESREAFIRSHWYPSMWRSAAMRPWAGTTLVQQCRWSPLVDYQT